MNFPLSGTLSDPDFTNVKKVASYSSAFAALKEDGTLEIFNLLNPNALPVPISAAVNWTNVRDVAIGPGLINGMGDFIVRLTEDNQVLVSQNSGLAETMNAFDFTGWNLISQ